MFVRRLLAGAILSLAIAHATAAGAAVLRCSGIPFPSSPVELSSVKHIVPLGNLDPKSGHTIPARHLYFYPNAKVEVRSPGAVELVAAIHYEEIDEWEFHLRPCQDVTLYLNHIIDIPLRLKNELQKIPPVVVKADDGKGVLLTLRMRPLQIALKAGEPIGWANNFDVGLVDKRKPPLAFAHPARYTPDVQAFLKSATLTATATTDAVLPIVLPQALYNRCAIDYFADPIKTQMLGKLKDAGGAVSAKWDPPCHSHMPDVLGTAQGNWWSETNSTNSFLRDKTAVSLSIWNVDPAVALFSFNDQAQSVIAAGTYTFKAGPASGAVNRPFAEVKDTKIYCYEGIAGNNGGPPLGAIILLQLEAYRSTIPNRMRVEIRKGQNSCGQPPWSIGSAIQLYR